MAKLRKLLALLLSLVMVLSFFPGALAEEPETEEPDSAQELDEAPGTISLISEEDAAEDLLAEPPKLPAEPLEESNLTGSCGDDVSWTLDGNGVLTISGSGPMTNYDPYYGYDFGIPENIVRSPFYEYRKQILTVIIEPGVSSVGSNSFETCEALTSASIPESVTVIGNGAFRSCRSLNAITLPPSLERIQESTFSGCSSLTNLIIPDGVRTIEDWALGNCTGLTSLSIPDGVRNIGGHAFYYCTSLTSLSLPSGITTIEQYTFSRCSGLTSLNLPSGLVSIGEGAFSGCSGLTSLNLPSGLVSIGEGAFSGCSGLTSLSLPSSISSIERYTFTECSGLTSFLIPDNVSSIGDRAFERCKGLTALTLPAGVTSLGSGVFSGCTALTGISVDPGNNSFQSIDGVLYTKDGQRLLAYPGGKTQDSFEVPSGVSIVEDYAFANCNGPANIVFPEGLTELGFQTFFCNHGILSVTIPEGITEIQTGVFFDCISLQSVSIPGSVRSIGSSAFDTCKSMSSLTIPEGVTSINYGAFKYCGSLTHISIPSSLVQVGNYAFNGCTAITRLDISDLSSWLSISRGQGCDLRGPLYLNGQPLREAVIPTGLSEIPSDSFYYCSMLQSVTIPDSITTIGHNAFEGCSALAEISIPDSVTSIDYGAFRDCSSLETINIPNSVTSINSSVFSGCSALADISIPKGVTNIGDSAFSDCSSLADITIPGNVNQIGSYAFKNCSSLSSIRFLGNAPEIEYKCFSGVTTTAYYPDGRNWDDYLENYGGSITWEAFVMVNILRQPEDKTVSPGESVSFSVEASGNNLSYQWFFKKPGSNWAPSTASCGTTATYTLTAEKRHYGYQYRCEITDEYTTICSEPATLYVRIAPIIRQQPEDLFVLSGDTASFSVVADGLDLQYQWFYRAPSENEWSPVNEESGTSSVYTLAALTEHDAYRYRCTVTNSLGSATSNDATLSVNTVPVITSQPEDGSEYVGFYVFFTVEATGGNLSYQWQRSSDEGTSWIDLDSATEGYDTPRLCVRAAADLNDSLYRCKVSNEKGTVFSRAARLTVENGSIASGSFEDGLCWTLDADGLLTISGNGAIPDCNDGSPWDDYREEIQVVLIEEGVTEIGSWALNCPNMRAVSLPDTLNKICSNAFVACNYIYSITIPANVTEIEEAAFYLCSSLEEILVDENNSCYKSVEGVLFSKDGGVLYQYPCGKISDEYTIPSGTTKLAGSAFFICQVKTLIIPASVTEIGDFCFGYCQTNAFAVDAENRNFKSVDGVLFTKDGTLLLAYPCARAGDYSVPSGVIRIEEEAFRNCRALSAVSIPASVTVIGEGAFTLCSSLASVTLSEGLSTIESCAFQVCNQLTSIQIPSTVNKIDEYAFHLCRNLNSISFTGPAPFLGEGCFNQVTATATYPAGDETWTEDVRQDYGGTITWVPVAGKPVITAQPMSVTVAEGSTATFSVTASGSDLSYQWQWSKDGGKTWKNSSSATVGYNTAALQVTASASRNGYQYRCIVSNGAGSVTSSPATLTVTVAEPVISTQPKSVSVTEGSTATFSVTAAGSGLSYQWQWSKDGGSTWNNSSSATVGYNTATLQVTASASRNGFRYRCKVSNSAGSVTSDAAILTVTAGKPVITVQPKSLTVSAGSTATFSVTATGSGLSYQWQWSKDGGTTWNNSSSATVGYNTATLQVTASASRNGFRYRCKVSNSAGSVTSNAATLTVNSYPVITAQPKNLTVFAGSTATFSVTATGASSYQWQWSKDGGTTWNNSSSATVGYNTATLQVTASASRNGFRYRCKVSNSAGSVTSDAAILTVSSKPVITAQPKSLTVFAGSTATFSVTATSASSYQWQWSKDGGTTWNNSSSATVGYNTATLQVTASASRNGFRYRCKVSNSAGSVTSDAAILTVSSKPVITAQPKSLTVSAGSTAAFTVTATGASSYQWQWSKDGGKTWNNSSSATVGYNTATLQVTASASRNGYQYRCVITNQNGSVTSSAATLTVR